MKNFYIKMERLCQVQPHPVKYPVNTSVASTTLIVSSDWLIVIYNTLTVVKYKIVFLSDHQLKNENK